MKKGLLIVLSGPSGAGKGTILAAAAAKGLDFALSISVTTRAPRGNEVDGVNYFFKTHDEVQQMIAEGQLLESKQVYGQIYGTSRQFVEQNLKNGKDVVLEIDTQGALEVKSKMPEAVLIFIVPRDLQTLHARLAGRGTETEAQIAARFGKAKGEIAEALKYDYLIVNDNLDDCVSQFVSIISAERLKVSREVNTQFIRSFK